jgi:probable phosphoglycerate mutase
VELLLIRHGLPVRREVSDGPADPELAPQGHAQAEHMANYLSTERIDAIYTSPLRRASETAAPLARVLGLDAVVEDDVAEYDRNASEYIPMEELKATGDPRFHEFASGLGVGLDDHDEFRHRVLTALGLIIDHHPAQTVAVVCHGGVINLFLASILGLPLDPPGFFYPNYTSINRVAASRSGVRSVVTVNETAHLRHTGLPMGLFQKGSP